MTNIQSITADVMNSLFAHMRSNVLFVFLDYDGTISPIVPDPQRAFLSDEMRQALYALSSICSLNVVTGRGLGVISLFLGEDLCRKVNIAASHGFDIQMMDGTLHQASAATDLENFKEFANYLRSRWTDFPDGCQLEESSHAISVHYRHVEASQVPSVLSMLKGIVSEYPSIRLTPGKMVLECRMALDWHKGKGVEWILSRNASGVSFENAFVIYLGDDVTDEDAFEYVNSLPHHCSILVEPKDAIDRESHAEYRLENVHSVLRFLNTIIKSRVAL